MKGVGFTSPASPTVELLIIVGFQKESWVLKSAVPSRLTQLQCVAPYHEYIDSQKKGLGGLLKKKENRKLGGVKMIWKAFRLGSDYEQNILYERIKLSKNKHTFF